MTPEQVILLLSDAGFTPGARHFDVLFSLLSGEREQADRAARVLARAGPAAGRAALERLRSAKPPERSRLVDVLGRVARDHPEPELLAAIEAALGDSDAKTRRSAIRALAHLTVPGTEQRLLELWPAAGVEERRALVTALGKIGGPAALALLTSATSEDPELSRIIAKSRLMLARTLARGHEARIALDHALPDRTTLCLRCRSGLGRLLADEARALGSVDPRSEAEVHLDWDQPLRPLLRLRTALDFGLIASLSKSLGLEAGVVEALARPEVGAMLSSWTLGTVRFRLAFSEGGHRRALVWRLAQAIAEKAPLLVNDPTTAPWEFVVDEPAGRLLLCPRGVDDRFDYRKRDVRGASHPTIAAALARQAGVEQDDVVWDPFVGSGLELIERAKLGAYRELHGSDVDAAALAAARENFAAAGLQPTSLSIADARAWNVARPTLILTNPPMGRRVARQAGLFELLSAFLRNAHERLAGKGRLVWLSPLPERTGRAAQALGFRVERREQVDLGGFSAELQIYRK